MTIKQAHERTLSKLGCASAALKAMTFANTSSGVKDARWRNEAMLYINEAIKIIKSEAAPDMYEALKEALEFISDNLPSPAADAYAAKVFEQGKKALAKAGGEG